MNGANDEGSGHGMAKVKRQAHKAHRTRPLQANTAGGQSVRHRPLRNNSQQLAGLAAKQQPAVDVGRPLSKTTAADDVGWPLAVQCR